MTKPEPAQIVRPTGGLCVPVRHCTRTDVDHRSTAPHVHSGRRVDGQGEAGSPVFGAPIHRNHSRVSGSSRIGGPYPLLSRSPRTEPPDTHGLHQRNRSHHGLGRARGYRRPRLPPTPCHNPRRYPIQVAAQATTSAQRKPSHFRLPGGIRGVRRWPSPERQCPSTPPMSSKPRRRSLRARPKDQAWARTPPNLTLTGALDGLRIHCKRDAAGRLSRSQVLTPGSLSQGVFRRSEGRVVFRIVRSSRSDD